jgi:hypothetical protein
MEGSPSSCGRDVLELNAEGRERRDTLILRDSNDMFLHVVPRIALFVQGCPESNSGRVSKAVTSLPEEVFQNAVERG